ncbi:MAG TPA: hypothetical protein VLA37_01895, partial [Sphingomonadaceae bacterium]|nr:hypothetical protein [Sphingomonadaceae bacterium]
MNELEEKLLREEVGDAKPRLCIRTKARIDAGRWWRRTPVWICVVGNDLVMLAVAKRRYFERIAIADCQASHYSHATGRLMIEPGESLRIRGFEMPPRDALQILSLIRDNQSSKPTLTT